MHQEDQKLPDTRFIPLAQWHKHHPWPTQQGLRYYHFNQRTNGAEKFGVFPRVGRKILVDEAAFFRWVRSAPDTKPVAPGAA